MKTRLPLLIIAVFGSGVSLLSVNAYAQQPPPGAPPAHPGIGIGTGMESHGPPRPRFSAADRAAFFDAHISGVHAGLQLTPEQEKLWPPVEAAMRAGKKSVVERMEKSRSETRPANAIALLRRMSEVDIENGETLKALADAAAPLYQSFTDEQKRRLPFLLHGLRMRGFETPEYDPRGEQHGEHEDEDPADAEYPPR
jgi:zinc resistance-associated protein